MNLKENEFNELYRRVLLDNTEVGEYVLALIGLREVGSPSHGMTFEFEKALDIELRFWHNKYVLECDVITRFEPQPDREINELSWLV